ncbi:deaminase [bacterium]|nr:deaminase [bacterium]
MDGRIATASGESRWITGEAARLEVHRLRASHDAVLVGSGTALADDPELTVRLDPPPARQPARIVLDTRLRLQAASRLFRTADAARLILAHDPSCAPRFAEASAAAEGDVVWWPTPLARGGRGVDLRALLALCAQLGIGSVMVEGGGEVAASFLRAGLVDRIEWFRAPILLGAEGRPAIGDLQVAALADAPGFTRTAECRIGADLWETYMRLNAGA